MRRNEGEKPGNLAYAVEGGGPPVVEYMQAIASIQADARSRYKGGVVDMEWDDGGDVTMLPWGGSK
jgi:hypothetical protein